MRVSFYGVRGSTPCASPSTQRYGGNTSCVAVDAPGVDPIVFDLGTGLRFLGADLGGCVAVRAHVLVTHLHWDHIQGLPFFEPVHHPDTHLDVYGPTHCGLGFADSFSQFMNPPLFPIHYSQLTGRVEFHDLEDSSVDLGGATVTSRQVPHVGTTNGYRVDIGAASVAYISDHQEPCGRPGHVDDGVLELADGVDLLIHDAQFTPALLRERLTWGHCTIDYAVEVARQSGARRLALFHHDPSHDDESLDRLLAETRCRALAEPFDIVSAYEGLTLDVGC